MKRRALQTVFVLGLTLTLMVAILAIRALTVTHSFTVRWTSSSSSSDADKLVTRTATLITGVDRFFVRRREEPAAPARSPGASGGADTGIHFEHEAWSTSVPRGPYWFGPPPDSFLGRHGFRYGEGPPLGLSYAGTTEQRWAAPVWSIFIVLGAVTALAFWRVNESARRRARIARGLCPACAYDLRGAAHDRCPECGHLVSVSDAHGNPSSLSTMK